MTIIYVLLLVVFAPGTTGSEYFVPAGGNHYGLGETAEADDGGFLGLGAIAGIIPAVLVASLLLNLFGQGGSVDPPADSGDITVMRMNMGGGGGGGGTTTCPPCPATTAATACPTTAPCVPKVQCPTDYFALQASATGPLVKKCYRVGTTALSYKAAQAFCSPYALVAIKDADEFNALTQFFQTGTGRPTADVWTDYTDGQDSAAGRLADRHDAVPNGVTFAAATTADVQCGFFTPTVTPFTTGNAACTTAKIPLCEANYGDYGCSTCP